MKYRYHNDTPRICGRCKVPLVYLPDRVVQQCHNCGWEWKLVRTTKRRWIVWPML